MSRSEPVDQEIGILQDVLATEKIVPTAAETLLKPYGEIATATIARYRALARPMVAGICGAQGSGKSTLALGVAALIVHRTGLRVATLSIDDFYLPRADRQALAATVHPLFATRGVPGTHDVGLAHDTLARLTGADGGNAIALPRFDKAADEPLIRSRWPLFPGPADIVLFEGWCVGARAQEDDALSAPINRLEREEDRQGIWRRAVNAALAGPYRRLFDRLDSLLLIAAPDFEVVFDWRREQERKLAERHLAAGLPMQAIMDDGALRRFIEHYERLTRHILAEMPARADGLMKMDAGRNIVSLRLP